jgi:phage replication O-like protein O
MGGDILNESDNKKGYTVVDHISYDVILPLLSLSAQAVYMRIYRQTIGWHKQGDDISNSQFRRTTGISSDTTVRSAIKELAKYNLIIVDAVSGITDLRKFLENLSPSDWRIKNYGINLEVVSIYGEFAKRMKELST